MDNIRKHALLEFKAAGWLDWNGNFKDSMQENICNHVLDLLKVFSDEGHSGSTAPYAVNLFKQLAMFEPIVPLTGEDWEWKDLGNNKYQNKRCSHVFKDADGSVYDSEGKIFWEWYKDEETGKKMKSYFTSRESRVPITFPYIPEKVYVERVE